MRTTFILLTALCVLPVPALADSMHCGNHFVDEGAQQGEVKLLCGEPTSIQQFKDTRMLPTDPPVVSEVHVELWIYDFGPHSFIQKLRFEDGELVQIRSGGYGTQEE